MKKFTAFFCAFLILLMLVFTGCSSNSDSVGTSKPASATPAPVKNTINPTATVNISLEDNTIYDETPFSIVIPKGSKLTQNGTTRYWTIGSDKYLIVISYLTVNSSLSASDLVKTQADLERNIKGIEEGANNTVKLDVGYQKITISEKSVIKLTGAYVNNPLSNIDIYLIDSNAGLLDIMIASAISEDNAQNKAERDKAISEIFDTIVIK